MKGVRPQALRLRRCSGPTFSLVECQSFPLVQAFDRHHNDIHVSILIKSSFDNLDDRSKHLPGAAVFQNFPSIGIEAIQTATVHLKYFWVLESCACGMRSTRGSKDIPTVTRVRVAVSEQIVSFELGRSYAKVSPGDPRGQGSTKLPSADPCESHNTLFRMHPATTDIKKPESLLLRRYSRHNHWFPWVYSLTQLEWRSPWVCITVISLGTKAVCWPLLAPPVYESTSPRLLRDLKMPEIVWHGITITTILRSTRPIRKLNRFSVSTPNTPNISVILVTLERLGCRIHVLTNYCSLYRLDSRDSSLRSSPTVR